MVPSDKAFEARCGEYLAYLYRIAGQKYRDCQEIDAIVQETMMAFLTKTSKGKPVAHVKGFLSATLHNQYNTYLRRKYRDQILVYGYLGDLDAEDPIAETEEREAKQQEYESTRREIGRLIRIYREVTVRYYVHGHSVDRIAAELGIPRGTVLSRLSSAREQIKEGLNHMEKYAPISYEPKRVALSIKGYRGLGGEPHTLIHSRIEQNILVLAYEKPVSLREIADSIGIPCAYLESIVESLVQGELMGRTAAGLVYTRCFLVRAREFYGDIPAQEAIASRRAKEVWEAAHRHFKTPMEREILAPLSSKQRATLLLAILYQALFIVCEECISRDHFGFENLPERPNGGRWLATGTVYENEEVEHPLYMSSGPTQYSYTTAQSKRACTLFDLQSVFGDTAFAYRRFKYRFTAHALTSFYASLLSDGGTVEDPRIYEMIPAFESMHTVRRDESGELRLDIPALPLAELEAHWYPARERLQAELSALLKKDLSCLLSRAKQAIPSHVDSRKYYKLANALRAYPIAQLLAIVNGGFFPYEVAVGKTPLIYLAYQ